MDMQEFEMRCECARHRQRRSEYGNFHIASGREYGIEDGDEIPRRAVDDLQDLGGGGLLLQSLARLSQQTRVLHCNHRLRREILQQRNLLIGEWRTSRWNAVMAPSSAWSLRNGTESRVGAPLNSAKIV